MCKPIIRQILEFIAQIKEPVLPENVFRVIRNSQNVGLGLLLTSSIYGDRKINELKKDHTQYKRESMGYDLAKQLINTVHLNGDILEQELIIIDVAELKKIRETL